MPVFFFGHCLETGWRPPDCAAISYIQINTATQWLNCCWLLSAARTDGCDWVQTIIETLLPLSHPRMPRYLPRPSIQQAASRQSWSTRKQSVRVLMKEYPACLLSTGSSMVRSKTLGVVKSLFAFAFGFASKNLKLSPLDFRPKPLKLVQGRQSRQSLQHPGMFSFQRMKWGDS